MDNHRTNIIINIVYKNFYRYLVQICSQYNLKLVMKTENSYTAVSTNIINFIFFIFGSNEIYFFNELSNEFFNVIEFLQIFSLNNIRENCDATQKNVINFLKNFNANNFKISGRYEDCGNYCQNIINYSISLTSNLFCTNNPLLNNINIDTAYFLFVYILFIKSLVFKTIHAELLKLEQKNTKFVNFLLQNLQSPASLLWRKILILQIENQIFKLLTSNDSEIFINEYNVLNNEFQQITIQFHNSNRTDTFEILVETLNIQSTTVPNNDEFTNLYEQPNTDLQRIINPQAIQYLLLQKLREKVENNIASDNERELYIIILREKVENNTANDNERELYNNFLTSAPSQFSFASDVSKMRKKMNKKQFYSEPKHYAKYSASPKKKQSKWHYHNDRIDSSSDEDD